MRCAATALVLFLAAAVSAHPMSWDLAESAFVPEGAFVEDEYSTHVQDTFNNLSPAVQYTTLAALNAMSKMRPEDSEIPAELLQEQFGIVSKGFNAVKSKVEGAIAQGKKFLMAKAGEFCRNSIKDAGEKFGLFAKAEAACGTTVCPGATGLLKKWHVPDSVVKPVNDFCTKQCVAAVKTVGPKIGETMSETICKAAGVEDDEQVKEFGLVQVRSFSAPSPAVQYTTLAALNAMSKMRPEDSEIPAELLQEQFGIVSKGFNAVKSKVEGAIAQGKKFLMAKA